MKLKQILVAAVLLMPTAALAAPGIVTATVGMRAGPGPGFPMVDRIPGGARVNIHGCLKGDAWCDVSWSNDRGWVSSQYLEYLYHGSYVFLPDYVDVIDVPIVAFELSSYWSSYYSGRPWYHRRAYWSSYWQSHARFATQMPTNRSGRLGRTETRTAVTEGRTRTGVTPRVTRQQSFANVRGAQADKGRLAHVNGANRSFSATRQPIVRGQPAPRFSAAPAARPAMPAHIAQPNAGSLNARAQIGAPRAAPAAPRMGGGGGGPRVGGGAPAGGPPGHERH